MVDHHSDGFKIGRAGNEKENAETAIRDEILEQRVEKLGHRVTMIAILIPVLIVVIFMIAFLDLKKSVFNIQDTGVERLSKLSEELESKFSSLSVRFAGLEENFNQREKSLKELEESFTKKIVPMEEIFLSMENTTQALKNANNAMKKNLEEIEKKVETALSKEAAEIQAIRENTIDKKELSSQFVVIDESLANLQADIRSMSSQMEQIDQNFKNELKSLTQYLAKEKTRLDQAIKATENLSNVVTEFRSEYKDFAKGTKGFVSDEELPLQIEKARLKLKVALDEAVRRMENRVADLERRIESSPSPSSSDGIIERNIQ